MEGNFHTDLATLPHEVGVVRWPSAGDTVGYRLRRPKLTPVSLISMIEDGVKRREREGKKGVEPIRKLKSRRLCWNNAVNQESLHAARKMQITTRLLWEYSHQPLSNKRDYTRYARDQPTNHTKTVHLLQLILVILGILCSFRMKSHRII